GDLDLGAVETHLDRAGRQGTGDIGEEAPGDEDLTRLLHVGRDLGSSRDVVVERREGQAAVGLGADTDPGEHGYRWAHRQGASSPRHGFGEDISLNSKLHGGGISFFLGRGRASAILHPQQLYRSWRRSCGRRWERAEGAGSVECWLSTFS